MNSADWVGIATLGVAALALLRSFGRDGTHWIKELFNTLSDRLTKVEGEHKSYAEQNSSVLRDHYVHRRDFEEHKSTQKEDIDEIKGFMKDMRQQIEKLPDVIIQRLKQ